MTTIKIPKGHVIVETALKVWPGKGAVDFAMRYVEDMMLEHVEAVCEDLVEGNFVEVDDKRVRSCQFCGYFYIDKTKNNSSLVCSDECKTGKDIVLKAYRRRIKNANKPKRLTYKQLYYASSYKAETAEYPFWTSDFHAREYDRKRGGYSYGDNLEEVIGKALLNIEMGGKKKPIQIIDYDGYEEAIPVAVNLSEKQHKTKECITIKRSAADIEADLLERIGAERLAKARYDAIMYSKGRYRI